MDEGKMVPGEPGSKAGEESVLILYNDEVNTFKHVIKSLVEVCGHDEIQAEQCAVIVHFKGQYEIKRGAPAVINAISRKLNSLGLKTGVITTGVKGEKGKK